MGIRLMELTFPERRNFSIREHVERSMNDAAHTHTVRVRFTSEGARFTTGRHRFGFAEEVVVGDYVEMLFYTPSLSWIAGWILSFAKHAEVLEPQALRDLLREWATGLVKRYC